MIQDSTTNFGGMLDVSNSIVMTSDFYHFDLNRFNQYKKKFKRLNSFAINCYSIKQTKTLLKAFETLGGFFTGYSQLVDKTIHKYNGRTKVLIQPIEINQAHETSDGRDYIKKILAVGDIEIMSFSSVENDSLAVEVLSMKDISENLPKGIKIIESYTDSIDLPFNVYDIEKSLIDMILQKNSIQNYSLIDLNK